ncbi:DUF4892 domain-containing protein [Rhizobium sp. S-51]|uniref:DUF4892 domain-containing protein n=1 Tax=Rhizobium terricola TaxID=2728849 RepID=A0A7Y0FXW4_9HYPH|nr:OmpA family protein [Rhizobium terricola]NML77007.1 DUF4892 domain-containing protein [Rhizobium terricola]
MRFLSLFCILLFTFGLMPAHARDVAGGKDHPLVGRYEEAVMTLYKTRDYEEQRLLVKPIRSADMRAAAGKRLSPANTLAIAGKAYRIRYEGPAGRSALEVARNFQADMKAKGFQILFECRGKDCSDGGGSELYFALHDESPMGTGDIHSSPDTQVYTALKLTRPEGDVYASVYVIDFAKKPEVLVDVIETQPMEEDKIVFVDAAEMERQIAANGRVSLYGILFDFDKATIKPESKPTLDEIAKFLTSSPDIKVVVAGHTDAKGGFDYNVDLSKRRAEAVVAALAASGISAGRMKPFGAGMAAPVATNDSEPGRTKNRRVELVKALEF